MRIAFAGPFGLHPNKTMGSRAMGLARSLVQAGNQVAIFMPPWQTPEEAGRSWNEDGVALRYVTLKGGVVGITNRLTQEILHWEPHIVHCFKPKAYSGLVAWRLWYFQRRLRLVVDTDDWEGYGGWNDLAPYSPLQKRFFSWQERWGMGHNHALTVASKALQSIALSQGIPEEKINYIPNGPGFTIDKENQPGKSAIARRKEELGIAGRPVLLLYSRFFEFDTSRLAAVLQGVKAAVPDIAILSIGQSLRTADAASLNQQFGAVGLLPSVVDLGWVDLPELPLNISLATVGLYLMDDTLLNRTKCPVKLIDQVSLGIPMVAEAVGQVPEYVIAGQSGLLRPPGDTDGLVADIITIIKDRQKREAYASAAKEHYQAQFTWRTLGGRLDKVYGEAL